MIYLWKNNIDNDNWIGFTSHRQKNKSSFILDEKNISKVLDLLKKYDIFCFHYLEFNSTISEQAESCHPKINKYIQYLFEEIYNQIIPNEYYTNNCGCFANYWIMSKNNFNEFMDWSYPKVLKIVELSKTQEYFSLGRHSSNSGYIIERLFILWYMIYNKKICGQFNYNIILSDPFSDIFS